jgi:hypothetical protein
MSRAFSLLCLCLLLGHPPSSQQPGADLGQIEFPTSGTPVAQPAFLRGVLLLHSFEYDDAKTAFAEANGSTPASPWRTGAKR